MLTRDDYIHKDMRKVIILSNMIKNSKYGVYETVNVIIVDKNTSVRSHVQISFGKV